MSLIEARIDAAAIAANTRTIIRHVGGLPLMAVVKADGYGHGLAIAAAAAVAGGASWLGVATADEARELRAAGIDAPILAWLLSPTDDIAALVATDVELGISTAAMLAAAAAAGRLIESPARVQLKVDTGLSRSGAAASDWPDLVATAAKLEAAGDIAVTGIWSHLACSETPDHPSNAAQREAFEAALQVADDAGLRPSVRHLANSGAALLSPELHYDLVRPGIAIYGLTPGGAATAVCKELGLRPAMTLTAKVMMTKRVGSGTGVSYGHRYVTDGETTLALVPVGYADGIPRAATNVAEVAVGGKRYLIAGTVCMDQFVIDVGDDPIVAGDEVVLFGPGDHGEPTADDWAAGIGTIGYEIVCGTSRDRVARTSTSPRGGMKS